MAFSRARILESLARLPFIDAGELAIILGEPLATVHRALTALLQDDLAQRVSHGTSCLPSSHRYYLTDKGISAAADALGYDAPSDFVRAYPVSRQWLALLLRRMDAVASVYRLAATLSPGVDGLETRVEFQRRGRFDAVITRRDGRSFGVVRQGLALRRRSLYDRLRAIAEYHHSRRPSVVLALVPSPWEQRLTDEFCWNADFRDYYIAVESRETLEGWERPDWISSNWAIGRTYRTLEQVVAQADPGAWFHPETPERKRASLPNPQRMVHNAPAFGISPAEKRALDLITDHPMIPRKHLTRWLGVSDGRVSQLTRNLTQTWALVERHGKRGDVRYTLAERGIGYVTHRDRAQLTTTMAAWSTEETADDHGRPRPLGHRILTWARQTPHADGITWFLSELAAEARADAGSELQWHVPTARADRAFNRGDDAIAPDAVGHLLTGGLHVPFCFEYELRARHPGAWRPGCGPTPATTAPTRPPRTSPRSPPRCSWWTPTKWRKPTQARQAGWQPWRCPSWCPVGRSCPIAGCWARPGVLCGNRKVRRWPCGNWAPGSGTACADGCVGGRHVMWADTAFSTRSLVRGRKRAIERWFRRLAGPPRRVKWTGRQQGTDCNSL